MRHRVKTRKLNRHQGARKGLEQALLVSIIDNASIKTTLPKAKFIKPKLEKLVTIAKKGDTLATRRLLLSRLQNNKDSVEKLFTKSKSYAKVNGGYTKILKANKRAGDNAKLAVLSWVEVESKIVEKTTDTKTKKTVTKAVKKEPTVKKAEKSKKETTKKVKKAK